MLILPWVCHIILLNNMFRIRHIISYFVNGRLYENGKEYSDRFYFKPGIFYL